MASNSLLALLNLSSSGTSSSKKVVSSSPPPPPAVVSPPPAVFNSNATANSLLQSILSPTPKKQSKPTLPDQPVSTPGISNSAATSNQDTLAPAPSPTPLTTQTPTTSSQPIPATANDLLALLSGTGNLKTGSEGEEEGDTSFHEQIPRSRMQPIGTPPSQSTRKDLSKSSIPTIFDSNNLFELLRQPQENEKKSGPSSSAPNTKDFSAEETKGISLQLVQSMPRVSQPIKPAYTINRSLHASHHLSGLHASAGFEDGISDGLDKLEIDGVQNFTLDLGSPQPAGLSSLYPAKLEITPISLLTTTFAPSCYINTDYEQSSLARWPSQRVAGMGGNVVMYVMSKGRIRVIDLTSGDRILARADSSIRSVFTPGNQRPGLLQDNRRNFAAITESGGLFVWLLKRDFGQSQDDAPITLQLFAETGMTFVFAQWLPMCEDNRLLVVQSDGKIALLSLASAQKEYKKNGAPLSLLQCPKATIIADVDSSGWRTVGVSVSSDGSLGGIVEASSSSTQEKLRLRLLSLSRQGQPAGMQHTVSLPSLAQLGCSNISFTSFVDDNKKQLPRGLLIGFEDNQVIALIDLTTGSLKQLYRFKAPSSSFSLAAWHSVTSTLILCCSIRSSIFSLRIQFAPLPSIKSTNIAREFGLQEGQVLDQSDEVIYRIKHKTLPCTVLTSQPALRECALPEPYTSFALDDTTIDQGSIRLIAAHLGGIHALLVPEEALTQNVVEEEKDQVQQEEKEVADESQKEEVKKSVVEKTLAVRGNAEVNGPSMETSFAPQSEAITEIKAPQQEVVSTPVSAVPLASTSEKKKLVGSKQGETKKKDPQSGISSKAAKIDKSIAPDTGSFSASISENSPIANDELKTLFAALESKLTSQLHARTSSDNLSSADTVRALADQLIPTMNAMIHDILGTQLKVAVDSAVFRCLPNELHNAILRPDLSNHLTRSITSSILPPIQKTAMDVVSRVLAPHFETVMSEMAAGIEAKINMGVTGIRKDIITEQSKALLETDADLKNLTMQMGAMTQSMGTLMLQNKKLEKTLEVIQSQMSVKAQSTPETNSNGNYAQSISIPATTNSHQGTPSSFTTLPSVGNASTPYSPHHGTMASHQNRQPSYHAVQPASASTPQTPASTSQHQQVSQSSPTGMTSQEVEDFLLSSLSSPNLDADTAPLQSCLSRIAIQCGGPVSAIWDKSADANNLGKSRISQAVILTLLHRLIKSLRASADQQNQNNNAQITAEFAVPWIEACAAALDKNDEVIARYYHHIRKEMMESLIQCHRLFKNRAYWWTEERLAFGILRFIQ